jgi:hypothetical protein
MGTTDSKRYLLAAAALLLAGCSWEEPVPPAEPDPADKVLVMYDNINNSPYLPFTDNVAAAGKAIAAGALAPDSRVIVYERLSSGNVIYELVKNEWVVGGYSKKEWKKFNRGENSSLTTQTIASIVDYIRSELYPEATHWGFAFGSHGSGWLPVGANIRLNRAPGEGFDDPFAPLWAVPENPLTRYFQGYGQTIEVAEFVDALDEWSWDFMLLDDCFMSSIEALYQMRDLADYIITSPTEIMIEGFPYDRVVKSVFTDWSETGFANVGREYVDYYGSRKTNPYGTNVVIKTSEIEGVAEKLRDIVRNGDLTHPDDTAMAGMQVYENLTVHVFHDFNQYVAHLSQTTPDLYALFAERLNRMVVYKGHTENFPSAYPSLEYITPMPIDPEHYSGISAFIPTATAQLAHFWRETDWYKFVYAE